MDRIGADEPAHLGDEHGVRPPVVRVAVSPDLGDLVRRHWLPVWTLPAGETTVQRVLQYPVCQLVVGPDSALLVGPARGLGTVELSGSGWAAGVMLQPAAASLLLQGSARVVDRQLPLSDLPGLPGDVVQRWVSTVREAMTDDPSAPSSQSAAVAAAEQALRSVPPVDGEGLLVNAVVEAVETDPDLRRVSQLAERFGLTERALQRLVSRRVGLTPGWLVRRRRLHEVAARLADPQPPDLAAVAADLGYADQAHLSRDVKAVTGATPRELAAQRRLG